MSSGGETKIPPYHYIYIEAPEGKAIKIFEKKFGRDPFNVTCSCCGEDYAVEEYPTLKQATGFHRNAPYTETKKDKDGLYMNNNPNACLYLDKGEKPPEGYKVAEDRFLHGKFVPLEEYIHQENVLVIRECDFK
jgi:hypothetical protein